MPRSVTPNVVPRLRHAQRPRGPGGGDAGELGDESPGGVGGDRAEHPEPGRAQRVPRRAEETGQQVDRQLGCPAMGVGGYHDEAALAAQALGAGHGLGVGLGPGHPLQPAQPAEGRQAGEGAGPGGRGAVLFGGGEEQELEWLDGEDGRRRPSLPVLKDADPVVARTGGGGQKLASGQQRPAVATAPVEGRRDEGHGDEPGGATARHPAGPRHGRGHPGLDGGAPHRDEGDPRAGRGGAGRSQEPDRCRQGAQHRHRHQQPAGQGDELAAAKAGEHAALVPAGEPVAGGISHARRASGRAA